MGGHRRGLWQAEAVPPAPPGAPRPFDRAEALHRLGREAFDVLVVGGGITGAGVALDAAARGLRTALVERADFASGTSSQSSKLVHGGIRYLQQGDVRLVYEALHERQRLLRNAPHLVQPLPFLIPLFGRDGVVSAGVSRAYATALWLYDLTGGWRIGRRHRRVGRDEALTHLPTLRTDRLVAGFLYWDAQTDDARLTLAVARTAACDFGAAVANYAEVVGLRRGVDGTVTGATVRLRGPGEDAELEVRATVVVNATGVWADGLRAMDQGPYTRMTRPAKGVHLTVPADRLPADIAAVVPVSHDRRSVFVVPWADGADTYVGTTDTPWDGDLDAPDCTAEDVAYLLGAVNAATTTTLRPEDVTGTWAGLRPLLDPGTGRAASDADRPTGAGAATADATGGADPNAARSRRRGAGATSGGGAGRVLANLVRRRRRAAAQRTADLSRRHRVLTSPSGLITVTGGKLTTYRLMAQDTVDEVVRRLGPAAPPGARHCPTQRLPLRGAPGTATVAVPPWDAPAAGANGTGQPAAGQPAAGAPAAGANGAQAPGGRAPGPDPAGPGPHQAGRGARTAATGTAAAEEALAARYGTEAPHLLALADGRPDLLEPLVPGLPYLRLEVLWAARHEMALTVADVLTRRTRASLRRAVAAMGSAEDVAALLAEATGRAPEAVRAEAAELVATLAAQLQRAGVPAGERSNR